MIFIIIIILAVSLILALFSMKDLGIPKEIARLIAIRKHRGSIVFFKDKVKHYSSSSKSSR
ncbi:MAG: hypothetical protein AAB929_03655 [Patescibacteria group bacterium]